MPIQNVRVSYSVHITTVNISTEHRQHFRENSNGSNGKTNMNNRSSVKSWLDLYYMGLCISVKDAHGFTVNSVLIILFRYAWDNFYFSLSLKGPSLVCWEILFSSQWFEILDDSREAQGCKRGYELHNQVYWKFTGVCVFVLLMCVKDSLCRSLSVPALFHRIICCMPRMPQFLSFF